LAVVSVALMASALAGSILRLEGLFLGLLRLEACFGALMEGMGICEMWLKLFVIGLPLKKCFKPFTCKVLYLQRFGR